MSKRPPASKTSPAASQPAGSAGVRLDKWLWAARFHKTRSLAVEDIDKGRVSVNDQAVKPSREVRVGDSVRLRQREQATPRVVRVLALSSVRGPAPVAQALYEETAESCAAREAWLASRAYAADPALSIEQGRPTKQARRQLEALGQTPQPVPWQRWSAALDDDT